MSALLTMTQTDPATSGSGTPDTVATHPGFVGVMQNYDTDHPTVMTWDATADDPYRTGLVHLLNADGDTSVCGRLTVLHGDGTQHSPATFGSVFGTVSCKLCARTSAMKALGQTAHWVVQNIIDGGRPEPTHRSHLAAVLALDGLLVFYASADPNVMRSDFSAVATEALPGTRLERRLLTADAVVAAYRTFTDVDERLRLGWANGWARLLMAANAFDEHASPATLEALREVRVLAALDRM